MTGYLAARVDALREHIGSLVAALPILPAEIARVREQIAGEMALRGVGTALLLLAGFIGLGFVVEAAYRSAVAPRTHGHRSKAIALRFARDAGALAAFALGSAAAFLAFDWPGHTRGAVMALLAAFIL